MIYNIKYEIKLLDFCFSWFKTALDASGDLNCMKIVRCLVKCWTMSVCWRPGHQQQSAERLQKHKHNFFMLYLMCQPFKLVSHENVF